MKKGIEKASKPFYTKWWLWTIIAIVLFCNIAVLLWVQNNDLKSNLLTLISGWVSFIATLLIGVIAFMQSKEYKEENDKFIKEQKNRLWEQSQYDRISTILDQLVYFREKYDTFNSLNIILDLQKNEKNEIYIIQKKASYSTELQRLNKRFLSFISVTTLLFDGTEKFIQIVYDCVGVFNSLEIKNLKTENENTNPFKLYITLYENAMELLDSMIFDATRTRTIIFDDYSYEYKKQHIKNLHDNYNDWYKRQEAKNKGA